MSSEKTVVFTWLSSGSERKAASILIRSIRDFGGKLSDCPIWVLDLDPENNSPFSGSEEENVEVIPLTLPQRLKHYYYGGKVYASFKAEEKAAKGVDTLLLMAVENLVIKSPVEFMLSNEYDIAVRPVHITNVGSLYEDELDQFWKGIYETVGIDDIVPSVESFIDGDQIRLYYNSAAFSVRPEKGIFRSWLDCFEILISDEEFQGDACGDETHKVFLHQAILSSLIARDLIQSRIKILPPDYVYPYNLQNSIPPERCVKILNDLNSIYYGSRTLNPNIIEDIQIIDPLRSWLLEHAVGD